MSFGLISVCHDEACLGTVQATAKLRRQVKRTKEVLSANSFAPISVEELMEGHDFRSRIDRLAPFPAHTS